MKYKSWIFVISDILFVIAAFLFSVWLKPASKTHYLPKYIIPFLAFFAIWVISGIVIGKYRILQQKGFKHIFGPLLLANFISLAIITTIMYAYQNFGFSRLIVFGTILIATSLELLIANVYYWVSLTRDEPDVLATPRQKKRLKERKPDPELSIRAQTIIQESSPEVLEYISKYADINSPESIVLETTTRFNVLNQPLDKYNYIVNLSRTNDYRYVNKFFEAVNDKLHKEGLFIGCAETKDMRKKRILGKYIWGINYFMYTLDYIVKRVFPKFNPTKWLYFFLTRGQNRVLSKAEVLGRLYSCGFEVENETAINGKLYFVARKTGNPVYDPDPSYGPLVKLRRIGKNGKIIKVYKMRTMHPYAEYLQQYIYDKYELKAGGKFDNDFRITTAGRYMRKFWIDELPMLINLFKGDLKIVGVRPLSRHYFSLYTKELQEKRTRTKPGLIPPFYADNPKTLDEIMASEMKYLDEYLASPLRTDFKYFWKAIFNIIFKGVRSS